MLPYGTVVIIIAVVVVEIATKSHSPSIQWQHVEKERDPPEDTLRRSLVSLSLSSSSDVMQRNMCIFLSSRIAEMKVNHVFSLNRPKMIRALGSSTMTCVSTAQPPNKRRSKVAWSNTGPVRRQKLSSTQQTRSFTIKLGVMY